MNTLKIIFILLLNFVTIGYAQVLSEESSHKSVTNTVVKGKFFEINETVNDQSPQGQLTRTLIARDYIKLTVFIRLT